MTAGPQFLVTRIQAWLVTTVTQGCEVLVTEPHGPVPIAVKKSLTVPQVVRLIVCTGTATEVWAVTVPMKFDTTLTPPPALVMVSRTYTPVRSAEPQLVTEPETV